MINSSFVYSQNIGPNDFQKFRANVQIFQYVSWNGKYTFGKIFHKFSVVTARLGRSRELLTLFNEKTCPKVIYQWKVRKAWTVLSASVTRSFCAQCFLKLSAAVRSACKAISWAHFRERERATLCTLSARIYNSKNTHRLRRILMFSSKTCSRFSGPRQKELVSRLFRFNNSILQSQRRWIGRAEKDWFLLESFFYVGSFRISQNSLNDRSNFYMVKPFKHILKHSFFAKILNCTNTVVQSAD